MHPPPPWTLTGWILIVPTGLDRGVMLADYRGPTLSYRELIVFSRAQLVHGRPGFVVSHIYVDDEQSRSGGREIWNLPKELAEFDVGPGRFAVRKDGERLLDARFRAHRGGLLRAIPTPASGALDGHAVLSVGRARIKASPALVTLNGRTRVGVLGDALQLTMPAPTRRS
jgi:acetoacetate decarboxylase